jgi:hypothetical protein
VVSHHDNGSYCFGEDGGVLSRAGGSSYILSNAMPFPSELSSILEILAYTIWCTINGSEWVNTGFHHVFASQDAVSAQLESAGLNFCSGLLEMLKHHSPPSESWLLGLSSHVEPNVWGVYAVVLVKTGYRTKLYIGSGTAANRGLKSRVSDYARQKILPLYVKYAISEGYSVANEGILV